MNKIIERLDMWGCDRVYSNGKYIANDYSSVVLREDFEHSYKELTKQMEFRFDTLFKSANDYDKFLEVPTVNEIKSKISELCGRKRTRVIYSFGKSSPVVNARYMLDIIKYLKVNEIKWDDFNKPVLFKGECGKAILLPVTGNTLEKGYYIK